MCFRSVSVDSLRSAWQIRMHHSVIAVTLGLLLAIYSGSGCATKRDNMLLENAPLVVYDQPITGAGLKNYRNTSERAIWYKKLKNKKLKFSIIGLDSLHASASAQFSQQGLEKILARAYSGVVIVDLRQESHGFINNGIPISWYGFRNQHNIDKSPAQIQSEEKQLLAALAANKVAAIHTFKKSKQGEVIPQQADNIQLTRVYSEAELAADLGIGYKRFFILDHHRPTDAEVDAFVKFIKNLPKDTWLHFHCRGGVGRATTFLTMYDMIRNAKRVKIQDILARQQDLFNTAEQADGAKAEAKAAKTASDIPEPGKEWKVGPAKDREKFINNFYKYVVDPKGYESTSWSEWLRYP